jgi:hypothetical protein
MEFERTGVGEPTSTDCPNDTFAVKRRSIGKEKSLQSVLTMGVPRYLQVAPQAYQIWVILVA